MMINIKRLFILTFVFTFFLVFEAMSQKINQVNKEGNRIGLWKKEYPNGKMRYTGTFNDGKEVGTFKFYKNTSSNLPHIVKEYVPGTNEAMVKFYNYDGKLKTKGKMIGKEREGAWIYYFTNGNIFSEEFYRNGKLDGVVKNYYSNKNLTEETVYKDGLKNGVSKVYTERGILIEEVIYVNGKLNGPAKYYDLKGKIKEEGVYKDNTREGKWEFYIDGEVSNRPKREAHSIRKKK